MAGPPEPPLDWDAAALMLGGGAAPDEAFLTELLCLFARDGRARVRNALAAAAEHRRALARELAQDRAAGQCDGDVGTGGDSGGGACSASRSAASAERGARRARAARSRAAHRPAPAA